MSLLVCKEKEYGVRDSHDIYDLFTEAGDNVIAFKYAGNEYRVTTKNRYGESKWQEVYFKRRNYYSIYNLFREAKIGKKKLTSIADKISGLRVTEKFYQNDTLKYPTLIPTALDMFPEVKEEMQRQGHFGGQNGILGWLT